MRICAGLVVKVLPLAAVCQVEPAVNSVRSSITVSVQPISAEWYRILQPTIPLPNYRNSHVLGHNLAFLITSIVKVTNSFTLYTKGASIRAQANLYPALPGRELECPQNLSSMQTYLPGPCRKVVAGACRRPHHKNHC
jgi:hypothetical protein